jgi:hypothetical protein
VERLDICSVAIEGQESIKEVMDHARNEAKSIFTVSHLGWLLWPESPTLNIKKIFRPIQQVSLTSHRRHGQRYCQSSSAFKNNYAALSYVWGGIEQFQPVSDNYEDLTQTDALHKMKTNLLAVNNDALHVCQSLSLQYLWMDSLCIVQDNLSHKAEQIAHMVMIYESAHLTIVATARFNANFGLPGLHAEPARAPAYAHLGTIRGPHIARASTASPMATISSSRCISCGWCFQEQVLSKRLLIFTEHYCIYHCSFKTLMEDELNHGNLTNITLLSKSRHKALHSKTILENGARIYTTI